MRSSSSRVLAAALLFAISTTACSQATGSPTPQPAPAPRPVNAADLLFMAGMIPHHAQAVKMAALAPERSSHSLLRALAERIVVGQRDEINLIQNWLRDYQQPVPPADATHHRMDHGGVMHDMLMPGMLTDEEMTQLERARGTEFDRLFLTFMIRHHAGALEMVDDLFDSYGAAQDDTVYRFASDVYADQTTEIDRMQKMLAELPRGR